MVDQKQFNSSPVNGLVGPRVNPLSPIIHCGRSGIKAIIRVLLADEVGLGKTIEAGLIMSALKHRAALIEYL